MRLLRRTNAGNVGTGALNEIIQRIENRNVRAAPGKGGTRIGVRITRADNLKRVIARQIGSGMGPDNAAIRFFIKA